MAEMAANRSGRFLNLIIVEDSIMKQPPDSYNSMSPSSRNGHSASNPEQSYVAHQLPLPQDTVTPDHAQPQILPMQDPSQPTFGTEIHLPRSRKQKFFIAIAFLLTGIAVLSIPLLVLQQQIGANFSSSTTSHSGPPLAGGNASTPTPTPEPMGKKILPPAGKILTGVSMPGDANAINNYEKDAGKKMSVLLSYQAWGDPTNGFPADWASPVREKGAIPMITWEPWKTKTYPQGNNEPTYALRNITDGKFDAYITTWAQSAKAWRYPFFLRFAPEMNGNWTPWSEGINGNKAGDFVKAWKHVHDIFTANGVTNATWVWCPNIKNGSDGAPLSEYYPGNEYVDWTAMDGFNWGASSQYSAWLTFSQVFGPTYNDILKITAKPMIISETGTVEQGGNKAAWISKAYSVELPGKFPDVKGIVWFNQITQEDWRIESSPAARLAFSQAIKASNYASNAFKNYMGE